MYILYQIYLTQKYTKLANWIDIFTQVLPKDFR